MRNDAKLKRAELVHHFEDIPVNSQVRVALKLLLHHDLEAIRDRMETENDTNALYRLQGECRALKHLLETFNGSAQS